MPQINKQEFISGVVNLTPDSFSDGGKLISAEQVLAHLKWLLLRGATAFDIGAQSTAPGRAQVGAHEEMRRLQVLLDGEINEWLHACALPISIDTYHPPVISHFCKHYFVRSQKQKIIWNDVSGVVDDDVLSFLQEMPQAGYVLCFNPVSNRLKVHSHTGLEMNFNPANIKSMAVEFFVQQLKKIPSEFYSRLILDGAYGFGKDAATNWSLLAQWSEVLALVKKQTSFNGGQMIGISKKRFLRQAVDNIIAGNQEQIYADSEIVHALILNELRGRLVDQTPMWWRVHDPLVLKAKELFNLH